jgi:hypothetical protein
MYLAQSDPGFTSPSQGVNPISYMDPAWFCLARSHKGMGVRKKE